MKVFACAVDGNPVFFENVQCTSCARRLAFLPDHGVISSLDPVEAPAGGDTPAAADAKGPANGDPLARVFKALAPVANGAEYRICKNAIDYGACNWAVPLADDSPYCRACRLNEIIPNLSTQHAVDSWLRVERAKRRLVYTLLELGLKVESRRERPGGGMGFAFKEDLGGVRVMTGHDDGLITLNLNEADTPFREKLREQMGEAYRTLLGHFRHEIGHYYWDRLIRGTQRLDAFRAEFGDESVSYEDALERHYAIGAPGDWPLRFVSAYASMHPWEDWAESWAHYLHMVDTLGTARSYGLVLRPDTGQGGSKGELTELKMATRNLHFHDFDDLLKGWVPLTVALNSLNRSMGHADLYPFVLSEKAIRKLRFVHDVIESAANE
jgi:hypothetical protein